MNARTDLSLTFNASNRYYNPDYIIFDTTDDIQLYVTVVNDDRMILQ